MVAIRDAEGIQVTDAIQGFLLDRQARALSPRTLEFYTDKLCAFQRFLAGEGIANLRDVTADVVRRYLLHLQRGHTAGGVHAMYRAVRAFLRWAELEEELVGWASPLRKVRAPKVPVEPLEPVPTDAIQAMLKMCERGTFLGDRDRAVLFALFDTGARAAEFLAMNRGDLDLGAGQILIRAGKGGRPRTVFLGAKSLRAVRQYLRHRPDIEAPTPLWTTNHGTRLSYTSLRDVLRRRARRAGVPEPSLHSFRRSFAISCLRNGMDIFSLQRLMGHSDLTVLRRYLAQTPADLQAAHQRGGPVDNSL